MSESPHSSPFLATSRGANNRINALQDQVLSKKKKWAVPTAHLQLFQKPGSNKFDLNLSHQTIYFNLESLTLTSIVQRHIRYAIGDMGKKKYCRHYLVRMTYLVHTTYFLVRTTYYLVRTTYYLVRTT